MDLNRKISEYIFEYIDYLKKEKKLSDNTISMYKRSLILFLDYCGAIIPCEINEDLINIKFRKFLDDKDCSLNYIAIIFQHLRFFLEYLKGNNINSLCPRLVSDSMIRKKAGMHSNKYKGDLVNCDEIKKMAKFWANSDLANLPRGIRNQVLIELLYCTGITVSELTHIMRGNIDLGKKILIINHYSGLTGYKNRVIKLNSSTVYWIDRYFSIREDQCQSLLVSFKAYREYIVKACPLSTKSMEDIVKETARGIKINKKITPMVFRNSLIYKKIKMGYKMQEINKFFGYSSNTRRFYSSRFELSDIA